MKENYIKQVRALNTQCVKMFKQKKYAEAINIGLKALQILLEAKADLVDIAVCYYNLGSSYQQYYEYPEIYFGGLPIKPEERFRLAVEYLNKALAAYNTLNLTGNIKKATNKIDLCFRRKLFNQFTSLQERIFTRCCNLKPIHIAVILNDFIEVQAIYARNPKCLEECDEMGWPPLMHSLFFKTSLELTSFLIKKSSHFLTKKYPPLPVMYFDSAIKEFGRDYKILKRDKRKGNCLDEDEVYPPIYYALISPNIFKNLSNHWSIEDFVAIIQLLIQFFPNQLQLVEGFDEDDHEEDENDFCALAKALALKLPDAIIKLLLKHTPEKTIIASRAINIALQSGYSKTLIELLMKAYQPNDLGQKSVLTDALEKNHPKDIIEMIVNINPGIVKQNKPGENIAIFAAIYYKASLDVVQLIFKQDPEIALTLSGANLLSYWDEDGTFEPGDNLSALGFALYCDRFDVADFLIQQLPALIDIKSEMNVWPINLVDYSKAPFDFIEKIITLSLPHLVKPESRWNPINRLLATDRKEIHDLIFRLGLGIGLELDNLRSDTNAAACIVIGMLVNKKPVTRELPGFEKSITNLKELCLARKQGIILKNDDEFEHYIRLLRLMLIPKKQEAKEPPEQKAKKTEVNINLIEQLRRWLILNKPKGSLVHLCLWSMHEHIEKFEINKLEQEMPKELLMRLH